MSLNSNRYRSNVCLFLVCAGVVCVFGGTVFGQPWDGNGVEGDPYLIWDANDMQAIGANGSYWGKHFRLMADIDLSAYTGTSFNMIGSVYPGKPFTGVFDGNGHTISNFSYTSTGTNYIGLFRYLDEPFHGPSAEIKGLGLINAEVDAGGKGECGSLVGSIGIGMVANCYAKDSNVSGDGPVGGLVGSNSGVISNCYFTGSVSGKDESAAGGLAGVNYGEVSDCYSVGSISGHWVGGLVGVNSATAFGSRILDCYARGSVYGRGTHGRRAGGLVGWNGDAITNCYSSASVSSRGSPLHGTGGLAGGNSGQISNCYATGSVSATWGHVGGLVGTQWGGGISNCYSTGGVIGDGDGNVGGLLGYRRRGPVNDSFWDVNASEVTWSAGGTGLPTGEMQRASTFLGAGWDFVTPIWTIDEGVDYPRLCWETDCAANTEPVACVVGGGRVVEADSNCEGRVVLDGSCSSDEDSTAGTNDDINDFDWYEIIDACDANSDVFLGSGQVIDCNLGLGEHVIILEVTDKSRAFDINEVTITVEDTAPPVITLNGSGTVMLECGVDSYVEEGAGVWDICDGNVAVIIGGDTVDTSVCGTYEVTYDATDASGNQAEQVLRTVIVEDTTPPEFSLSVEPNVLWPPNNKMILVAPGWEVSDNCDEEVEVSLVDITMSAEGDVSDYVQIGGDGSINLRARKGSAGAVRIYTLTYEAVDDSGNVAVDSASVVVPHDRR